MGPSLIENNSNKLHAVLGLWGYENLKEKQLKVVVYFMEENDTFVVLPTSCYKSLIYTIIPLSFDKFKSMLTL